MGSSAMTSETAPLLEAEEPERRCCCNRFRVYGSDSVCSWGVAFANFLVNFIIVGLGRMGAIFYVDFINFFHIDRKTASIPFSVQQAGRNLFGPVAGILGQKYGIRRITIFGGIIGSISAAGEYFKMDITTVTFLWGLLFGLSTALTTTINQVSIDQYFEEYRTSAGGFAFSGGCIGALFFPIVIETLIHNYGMQGTFLAMAAIILFVVPAAMVLVEPPWKEDNFDTSSKWNGSQYGALEEGKEIHPVMISQEQIKMVKSNVNFKFLEENEDMVYQFLTINILDGSVRPKIKQDDACNFEKLRILEALKDIYFMASDGENLSQDNSSVSFLIQKAISNQPTDRPQCEKFMDISSDSANDHNTNNDTQCRIFIEHKLQDLSGMQGTRIVSHFLYSEQHLAWKVLLELRKLSEELLDIPIKLTLIGGTYSPVPTEHTIDDAQAGNSGQYSGSVVVTNQSVPAEHATDDVQTEDSGQYSGPVDVTSQSNSFCSHIKTAIRLHKNPLFLLICLCRGVFMLTFVPLATIAVDFAMDHGLNKSDGKYVIAILSLGDFIGRIGLGWITDRKYVSLSKFMVIGMIALGVSNATLPLVNCKTSILISLLIFAILQGALFVRHNILVTDYVKSQEKAIAMGFINFLSGFLGFALPAYIGYFRDNLGSYNCMFYVNGGICCAVGLLWLLEPCLSLFVLSHRETF